MRNPTMLAAVAAMLLAGGVAVAKDRPAEAPKAKMICRGEADLGSRLQRKQVCLTKAEWDQMAVEERGGSKGSLRGSGRGNR